jgi:hypothetical protein
MQIIPKAHSITYASDTSDWRLTLEPGVFRIEPQVGAWEYASGTNLDHLAALIVSAKAHATANGVNWDGI